MAVDVVVGGVGVHSAGSFSAAVVTREGYVNGLEGGRGEVAHGGGRGVVVVTVMVTVMVIVVVSELRSDYSITSKRVQWLYIVSNMSKGKG